MQTNPLWRKGLACTLVVLFAGASVTAPAGSASQGKTLDDKPMALMTPGHIAYAWDCTNWSMVSFYLNDPGNVTGGDGWGLYFMTGSDFDESGNWYAVSYQGGLFEIDNDTGIATYIAYAIPLNSMTYDTTQGIWYVSGYDSSYIDSLLTINVATGAASLIGHYGISNLMISIMCDSSGHLYGYDASFGGNSQLYSIDKNTGEATVIGDMGYDFCYAQEGKFDRDNNLLYIAGWDFVNQSSGLYLCDPGSGVCTLVGYFGNGHEMDGLSIPYTQVHYDHDVGVKEIKVPVTGIAGVIAPEITVKNYGLSDEYFPTEARISKKIYSDYLLEDFEGSFPPAGWTVETLSGGSWHRNDYWSTPRHNDAGTGYCADADVGMEGNAPMMTFLTSPPMNLSNAPGAVLTVDLYEYVSYNDILLIDISVDGGNNWTNLYKITSTYVYGYLYHMQEDLSDFAGYSDARLRFGYFAPSASDGYWEIDHVKVRSINWSLEYDQQFFTNLSTGQTANLTFPTWTPADLDISENVDIEYKCDAQTLLPGDLYQFNDMKEKTFTLHYGYYHDVAITDIPSPASGLAQSQPVAVSLRNNGQNTEAVNVSVQIGKIMDFTEFFSEHFSGSALPPGWGTNDSNNWCISSSNYAGGQVPELEFNWHPEIVGDQMVYTTPIDTSAYSGLQLSFKQYVNDYNGEYYTLYVKTSIDDGDTWNTVYTQAAGPFGPTTTTVTITGGSPNLRIAWVFSGDSYNINYWYIDDVSLSSYSLMTEYNQTVTVDASPGSSLQVTLPDWTPEDVPLATSVDYLIDASATMNNVDEYPADNEQVKQINLSYEHDVGVTEIILPSQPPRSPLPPDYYPLEANIRNFGATFNESNIPAEARITHVDNNTIIYDQTLTVPGPLSPGETILVSFPDFYFGNDSAWEGLYRVDVWTALSGDDHPENDKATTHFEYSIPDYLPPITNHILNGTTGLNGWYVSNVILILNAYDPCPPMKDDPKPPSGVDHTYYKLHAEDLWTEYVGFPVTVGIDDRYELYYYSIDKAGNNETPKGPFPFNIDQTPPTVNLTAIPQNILKTHWLLIINASDETSGLECVEIYIDDVLIGNLTTPPWQFMYNGSGMAATVIACDEAGNKRGSNAVKDLSLLMDFQAATPNVLPSTQQRLLLQQ